MANWRLAESLKKLREQINAEFPNRSRASDGSIGDTAHSARKSDHNPNNAGVVCAVDITHDSRSGCTGDKLAAALVESRDERIKYLIFNRRIFKTYPASGKPAWAWHPYTGANAHTKHIHISVQPEKRFYDSKDEWDLDLDIAVTQPLLRASDAPDPQQSGDDSQASEPSDKAITSDLSNPTINESSDALNAQNSPNSASPQATETTPQQTNEAGGSGQQIILQPNATAEAAPVVKGPLDGVAEIASTGMGFVSKRLTWGTLTGGGLATVWAALQNNWIAILIGFVFAMFLIMVGVGIFVLAYYWAQKKKITEAQIRADPGLFNVKFEK